MRKLLVLFCLITILFSIGFVVAAGTCSGSVHSCSSHNGDESGCEAAGCNYNTQQSKCVGSHNACSTYSSQSNCETHSCTWTEEETPVEGEGMQKVIGIYPRIPVSGDKLYSETLQLKVEIFYAGEPDNGADVKANSSMFGEVVLNHESGYPTGIYVANVTIKDTDYGNKRITYIAEESGQYNEASVFVELKPSLEIITDLDKMYYKDSLMRFNGTILNKNNTGENNSIVKISGYFNENKIFYIETFTNKEGDFYSEYLVKHGDPEGAWKILIEAESEKKEVGSKSLSTQISVPAGVLYYSVNFLSPLQEKTFRRGEVVPITIEVKDLNGAVNRASVIVYAPSGDSIILKEVGDGKYSGSYLIKPDDLIDNWFLRAEVQKQEGNATKVGGANIPITVSSAEIKFNILSPSSDVTYTNSRMKIRLKLTYSDGSLVRGANLNAILLDKNEEIQLQEVSNGIYEGSYFVGAEETGTLMIKTYARDINDNFGTLNKAVSIRKRSFVGNILALIWDIAKQYWWLILIALIAVTLIYEPKVEISWIKGRIKKSSDEQKKIKAMQIDLEKRYYNEGAITKKEFRDIMEKYEERTSKAKEDEKVFTKRLTENLDKIKKRKDKIQMHLNNFRRKPVKKFN